MSVTYPTTDSLVCTVRSAALLRLDVRTMPGAPSTLLGIGGTSFELALLDVGTVADAYACLLGLVGTAGVLASFDLCAMTDAYAYAHGSLAFCLVRAAVYAAALDLGSVCSLFGGKRG